jgi:2,3-bisphosphoglycerate-dependent phosphoglycerate mutase
MESAVRTIHVVTHPEATHHVEGLVGGWYDSELTAVGKRDAAAIADALYSDVPNAAAIEVIASDLRRTVQTAESIAAVFDTEPILDSRLREKSYGLAEGRPQAWLDEQFIPPPVAGDRMGHDEGVPGAETKTTFAQRICYLNLRSQPGGITTLREDGFFHNCQLVRMSDTSHLE